MTILILGAGLMQKPAISAAKAAGCYVAVVDGNPQALGAPYADHFEVIDLKDIVQLEAFARQLQQKRGLDGVFTAGTDFSASVAFIAERLSLPGHSYEAACNATDKTRMRACFAQAHVPSPHFIKIDTNTFAELKNSHPNTLPSLFDGLDFPVVIKPADNMGGRGCKRAENTADLYAAIAEALPFSRTHTVIVEEFIDGKEFSLDALVSDGKVEITGFADRHVFYSPHFIEMGHTMPTDISESEKQAIIDVFVRGIHALGLTHGAAKGDMKLSSKGAMIGEIAARLSGGYMSGWTYPYASGVNITERALMLALGQNPPPLAETLTLTSAERAWISIPGIVLSVHGLDAARHIPFVKDVFQRSKEGDTLRFPQNNVEKCGNIITTAPTRAQAIAAAEKARSKIAIRLEAHNAGTDTFLEQAIDTPYPPSAFVKNNNILALIESGETDWNGRTVQETLDLFEEITTIPFEDMLRRGIHGGIRQEHILHLLRRGGIQGLLYLYDTNPVFQCHTG